MTNMSANNTGKSRGSGKKTEYLRLFASYPFHIFSSMLKNIPPLLTPDALHALASMGHGDDLAIVDANFPASAMAARNGARLVQLAGATSPQALQAVLHLLPLDNFVPDAAWTMQVVGDAHAVPAPVAEFAALLGLAGERPAVALERFEFYARAQTAFLILQTGEQRKYGNILLRKGVISSDAG